MMFALRYGLRRIRASPLFALTVILTLALAIGGNGVIFSVIDCVLIRPLPYHRSEQIVRVFETFPVKTGAGFGSASALNFLDWRGEAHIFESLAAYSVQSRNLTQTDRPAALTTASVTEDFFQVFGVAARLGRTFRPEEIRNDEMEAVVSEAFWQDHFGRDPAVIGSKILLDDRPYSVIGVMPASFQVPTQPDVWLPLTLPSDALRERSYHSLSVVGRVREGRAIAAAEAEMSAIAAALARAHPESNSGRGILIRTLKQQVVGNVRPVLLALFGAVGFTLLIACANIANLLLARSPQRLREMALRTALGASRARLAGQMIVENLLLAILGGTAGVFLAILGLNALRLLSPGILPRAAEIGMKGDTLAFVLALSILSGLAFGAAPVYQLARFGSKQPLNENGRGVAGSARVSALRNVLAVFQIALSLILLVAAELMAKSLFRLQAVDPGFRPDHVITAQLALPSARYSNRTQAALFFDALLSQLRTIPAIQGAAVVVNLPFGGNSMNGPFRIEGLPAFDPAHAPLAEYVMITSGYLRTLRIPLLAGRDFNADDASGRPRVALVNDTMAKLFWPNASPVGRHFVSGDAAHPVLIEIVGVVADLKLYGLDHSAPAQIYLPLMQQPALTATILVRSENDPKTVISSIRSKVQGLDKDQPVSKVRLMEDLVSDSLGRTRFRTLLTSLFAMLSLILAAIGLYGVIAYASAQRTAEIGIRMALGASPRNILLKVTREAFLLAAAGVFLGVCMALALTPLLKAELYGITPMDPRTLLEVAILLVGVALLASAVPAFRACKISPVAALRQ